VRADYVITSRNGFDPFAVAAGDAVPGTQGVELVSNVRNEHARVFRSDVTVDGIDPAITGVYHYRWESGSDDVVRTLGVDQAVVSKNFADKHKLDLHDIMRLTTPDGQHYLFGIQGIFSPPKIDKLDPVLGSIVISQLAFRQTFARPKNIYTFINASAGANDVTTAALKQRLAAYPDAKVQTKEQWVTKRSAGINKLLNLLYVLLALSVLISLFGMVNTLVLSVFERTRELGMLRAVGMTRRQTRSMVRHESVITALIGAALGLPLGILMAALLTRALADQGVAFKVPVIYLVAFALVAVIAGIVAAIVPARRAAALNVLEALQYE
jgi:putative ABC transport system permease protein